SGRNSSQRRNQQSQDRHHDSRDGDVETELVGLDRTPRAPYERFVADVPFLFRFQALETGITCGLFTMGGLDLLALLTAFVVAGFAQDTTAASFMNVIWARELLAVFAGNPAGLAKDFLAFNAI